MFWEEDNCSTDFIWKHFQWNTNIWYEIEIKPDSWKSEDQITWNTWTNSPCAPWYHIPSTEEWQTIIDIWILPDEEEKFSIMIWDLFLPFAPHRNEDSLFEFNENWGIYWSSQTSSENTAYTTNIVPWEIIIWEEVPLTSWQVIRCVKDK